MKLARFIVKRSESKVMSKAALKTVYTMSTVKERKKARAGELSGWGWLYYSVEIVFYYEIVIYYKSVL